MNLGAMKKGQQFKITIEYPKGKAGDITCHVRSLDYGTWDKAYEMLADNMLTVTDHSDNHLEGAIDVKEAGVLVTSIPYDKGWKLEVDGRQKEIQELTGGVFISVPLDEGEHDISLTFRPPGLIAGMIISILSILVLAAAMAIRKRQLMSAIELPGISEDQVYQQEEADCNKI